eukprot:scpid86821/ scgid22508/ 
MKCYDENSGLTKAQSDFNYCAIRTRRAVENAIGRLKGRWQILTGNSIRDPVLARRVARVAEALHKSLERCQCPVEETWIPPLPDHNADVQQHGNHGLGAKAEVV